MNPGRDESAFILSSCLKGTPKDWWDLVKQENNTIESFCEKFKDRYWNENVQYETKRKLEFGHYVPSAETSMSTYAIKIFRDAKGLNPPLRDAEIIQKLSRHFNEEIRVAILGRHIQVLQDLLELLERFDNFGTLNSKRGESSKTKTENWRNRGNKQDQEKPAIPRKDDNWRAKERGRNPNTRTVRSVTTSEDKGGEKEEETTEEVTTIEEEN